MPDVRPELALDPLELVDLHQRSAVFLHNGQLLDGLECLGIHIFEHMSALIEYQVGAVSRHAPAVALIREFPKQFKILRVEYTTEAILPRQHVDLIADHGNA